MKNLLRFLAFVLMVGGLIGCATTESTVVAEAPNLAFSGTLASGNVTGERSVQVLSEIETRLLQVFPRAKLLPNNSNQADVLFSKGNRYKVDTRNSQLPPLV